MLDCVTKLAIVLQCNVNLKKKTLLFKSGETGFASYIFVPDGADKDRQAAGDKAILTHHISTMPNSELIEIKPALAMQLTSIAITTVAIFKTLI